MIKKNAYYIIFCLFLLSTGKVNAQQNIQFTQYIFNSLTVNPAYAGYKEEWFAQLALRNQWVGINGSPKIGQLSIDGIIDPTHKRMGLGLQLTADKLGPQAATSAYANYAFRLRLNQMDTKRLSFGIGAGVTQYRLDGTKLQSGSGENNNDPGLRYGRESEFVPDLRFGIYYSSPDFYFGASVMDLLSSRLNESLFKQENNPFTIARTRHLYVIAGTLFDIDTDLKIRPSILVKEDFKGPTSIDLNAMVIFADRFWIGGGYRTGVKLWKKEFEQDGNAQRQMNLSKLNSFSGVAQFYISERIRIGYSYDYMLSELSNLQNGTHEISIGLTFPQKGQRLLSPRFF
jgi:type IX secretion system PorP/SprF family membrane protein